MEGESSHPCGGLFVSKILTTGFTNYNSAFMKKFISKKENLIISILVLAVIAIGVSFFAYARSKNHQVPAISQNRSAVTPASTVSASNAQAGQSDPNTPSASNPTSSTKPTTKSSQASYSDAGMSTYTSTQYGLSFKYPANMICTETHRFINGTAQVESNMVGGNSGSAAVDKYAAGIADADFQGAANGGITCGNVSINGSQANNAGGGLELMSDNGTSLRRTNLQNTIQPSQTVTIGANTFYKVPNMPNYLVIFKPTYMLEVTDVAELVPPNHIDLSSLKFQ
jgi:hypothetical protein